MFSHSQRLLMCSVLVMLAATFGAGCDRLHDALTEAGVVSENNGASAEPASASAQEARGASPRASASTPDNVLRKLRRYEACILSASRRAKDARAYYLAWIRNNVAGPTGRERLVYVIHSLHTRSCTKSLEAAADREPALPKLDVLARTYGVRLAKLNAQVEQVRPYYERKDYKDDGMAKGKSMHAPLMAAFDAFLAADRELRVELAKRLSPAEEAELARLQASRPTLYRWRRMVQRLRVVLRLLDGRQKPEPAELRAALDRFTKSVDAMTAETKSRPMRRVRLHEVEECLKTAKEARRAIEAGREPRSFFTSRTSSYPNDAYRACEEVLESNNRLDVRDF